ncbi:MAG: FG-GAP-like repeat-containing protein, partial [Myxococcota bacterium]
MISPLRLSSIIPSILIIALSGFLALPAQAAITVYTDQAAWEAATTASIGVPETFVTNATNVDLASELGPGDTFPGASLPGTLAFLPVDTGFCSAFELLTIQAGADFVFEDGTPTPGLFGSNYLSVGDFNVYENDDFEISFPDSDAYAVSFYLMDNSPEAGESITVEGFSGTILTLDVSDPDFPGLVQSGAFIGFVADEGIRRITFDEGAGGDDLAIRDLGVAPSVSGDRDGDGLSDCEEFAAVEFYDDLAEWEGATLATRAPFAFTPGNIILAQEVLIPPFFENTTLDGDGTLTFPEAFTNLCGSFVLRALQPGASFVFEDRDFGNTGNPFPFGDDSLSIGEINVHETDSFEIEFTSARPHEIGVTLRASSATAGETFMLFGESGLLRTITSNDLPTGQSDFIGFTSAEPIERVVFLASPTGGDDQALGSLHFTSTAGEDSDGDGIDDCAERAAGTSILSQDTDGDFLNDDWELANGLDPVDPDEDSNGVLDGQDDPDLDGLPTEAEIRRGTDFNNPDTDSDGLSDGVEVASVEYRDAYVLPEPPLGANEIFLSSSAPPTLFLVSQSEATIDFYRNETRFGLFDFEPAERMANLSGQINSYQFVSNFVEGRGYYLVLKGTEPIQYYTNSQVFGSTETRFEAAGNIVSNSEHSGPTDAAVADFDGDGELDVAIAFFSGAGALDWYSNNDDGTFTDRANLSTNAPWSAVRAADLDGDGDPDILSAASAIDTVEWFENDGIGNFTPRGSITTNADGVRDILAIDIDRDGDLDVVSASGQDDKVAWYKNDGSGNFTDGAVVTTDAEAVLSIRAGDLDSDGDIDIVSTSYADNLVDWYANDGFGNFEDRTAVRTVGGALAAEIANLNGTGALEVVVLGGSDFVIMTPRSLNPLDSDRDNDGLLDGFEVLYGFDPYVNGGEANADGDGDGLINSQEQFWNTDPTNPDHDGDGLSDGYEVLTSGTDPDNFWSFEVVPILLPLGAAGNAADVTGFGAVSSTTTVAPFEVTKRQYAAFLNAVAADDPNGLFVSTPISSYGLVRTGTAGEYRYEVEPGYDDHPANLVSFYSALRFANWMHNGQPTGPAGPDTTEDGAYTITPAGIAGNSLVANSLEALYRLPSEDEWYKAAYYDPTSGSYNDSPIVNGIAINCAAPIGGPGAANCGLTSPATGTTPVGAYIGSFSEFWTYDQGGNVAEWTEDIDGPNRRVRGGDFTQGATSLNAASSGASFDPLFGYSTVGFRLVPEPSFGLGALLGGGLALAMGRRRARGG